MLNNNLLDLAWLLLGRLLLDWLLDWQLLDWQLLDWQLLDWQLLDWQVLVAGVGLALVGLTIVRLALVGLTIVRLALVGLTHVVLTLFELAVGLVGWVDGRNIVDLIAGLVWLLLLLVQYQLLSIPQDVVDDLLAFLLLMVRLCLSTLLIGWYEVLEMVSCWECLPIKLYISAMVDLMLPRKGVPCVGRLLLLSHNKY
jgi:hypothetical protein